MSPPAEPGDYSGEFIRSDMREEAMKFFGRQFVKGIPNTYSEYPVIVKDGREIWLGQNTQLIFQDGKVVKRCLRQTDSAYRYREEYQYVFGMTGTDMMSIRRGLTGARGSVKRRAWTTP